MIIVLKPDITRKQETDVLQEIRKLRLQAARHARRRAHRHRRHRRRAHPPVARNARPPGPQVERSCRCRSATSSSAARRTPRTPPSRCASTSSAGEKFQVMAGPCSVESEKQLLMTAAQAVKKAGATILRGGAFKPRTSPYEFQGLGEKGLKLLAKARRETGLAVITELLSEAHAGPGGRIRRHHPDRRAQRAELPTPHRRRQDRQADPAQARAFDEDRGMAAGRRIRARQRATPT